MSINVQLTYDWTVTKYIGTEFSKCRDGDKHTVNIIIHSQVDKYYLNKTMNDVKKPPVKMLLCEKVGKDETIITIYDDIEMAYRPVELPGLWGYDPIMMLTVKSTMFVKYHEKHEKFKQNHLDKSKITDFIIT